MARLNVPGDCDYYPCHFEGQDCAHCFCPLYPCQDIDLGEYIISSKGRHVWSCMKCELIHQPQVAKYLSEHPEATTQELKSLAGTPRI